MCCRAGDMVVWDSRLVHCNTPGQLHLAHGASKGEVEETTGVPAENSRTDGSDAPPREQPADADDSGSSREKSHNELIRMVGYVCMLPASTATESVLRSRIMGFASSTQTSHWPDAYVLFSLLARSSNCLG